MPRTTRRRWAVALLPLLVFLLSGWTSPGGWYCANGEWCEPASSAGCCCEVDDCRFEAADPLASSGVGTPDCGCYFESLPVDASTSIAGQSHPSPAEHAAPYRVASPFSDYSPRAIRRSLGTPLPGLNDSNECRGPPIA